MRSYLALVRRDGSGGYLIEAPDLPGWRASAPTVADGFALAQRAVQDHDDSDACTAPSSLSLDEALALPGVVAAAELRPL